MKRKIIYDGVSYVEEFGKAKQELLKYNNADKIWDSPLAQILMIGVKSLTSPLDGISSSVEAMLKKNQKKKLETVLKIIVEDKGITTDMVEDVTVIMEFAKMIDAVNRLAANDKLVYFGKLFQSAVKEEEFPVDEYDEFLQKLSDLSSREIRILVDLRAEQKDRGIAIQNEHGEPDIGIKPREIWDSFVEKESKVLGITEGMLTAIVSGITRSGFVQAIEIPVLSASTQTYYITTPYFERFCERMIE